MPTVRPIRRYRTDEPWRFGIPTRRLIGYVGGKGLRLPEDGWSAAEFARSGRLLITTLHRLAIMTQRKAAPHVARIAKAIMRRQMQEVVAIATRHIRPGKSGLVDIMLPDHAAVWMRALNDVFQNAGIEATIELMPPIQSVMGQGYSKTGALLVQEADAAAHQRLATESRDIARRITGLNDTTRNQFERVIGSAIRDELSLSDTARQLVENFPDMSSSRILTIARTELNNAWTRGSVVSLQESETVTHVSVIGCQAREERSPQYRGESTCNIEDVPVFDAHLLEFHPNHSGVLVPSRFRD